MRRIQKLNERREKHQGFGSEMRKDHPKGQTIGKGKKKKEEKVI